MDRAYLEWLLAETQHKRHEPYCDPEFLNAVEKLVTQELERLEREG